MTQLSLPPLSLYVHIPWCVQKCPYCDFNSHAQPERIPEDAYINCLLDDLRQDLHFVQGRPLHSIFIGGGTPSLFSAAGIARLLSGIRQLIEFEAEIEITLEANPGTFEQERFIGFSDAGVNRLSIGIQSLNDGHLKRLGRIHNPEQARRAASLAGQLHSSAHSKTTLHSFNLDVMHGLPEQTHDQAMADLEGVIALNPPHISWYQLTIEPNTMFASQPPALPDDDTLWEIFSKGDERLRAAGYEQYEVSAYGKPGHHGRHNLNYWRFGDYLGIGCGAHGKITEPHNHRIVRTEKVKHPRGYLDLTRSYTYRQWDIEPQDRVFEFFLNQLRLTEPTPKVRFTELTGLNILHAQKALHQAVERELIKDTGSEWQTTARGRLYLNSILADLMTDTD